MSLVRSLTVHLSPDISGVFHATGENAPPIASSLPAARVAGCPLSAVPESKRHPLLAMCSQLRCPLTRRWKWFTLVSLPPYTVNLPSHTPCGPLHLSRSRDLAQALAETDLCHNSCPTGVQSRSLTCAVFAAGSLISPSRIWLFLDRLLWCLQRVDSRAEVIAPFIARYSGSISSPVQHRLFLPHSLPSLA